MRKVMLVVLAIAMAAVACGGSDVGDSVEPSTTVSTSTVSTAAVPKQNDPAVRAKVRKALQGFYGEYGELLKGIDTNATALDDAAVDQQITEACDAKAKGYKATDEELGAVMMFFGAKLQTMGKDVSTFMDDSFGVYRKIADLVDC